MTMPHIYVGNSPALEYRRQAHHVDQKHVVSESVTFTEILSGLSSSSTKSCSIDPTSTGLLKRPSVQIVAAVCNLCNYSLQAGFFHSSLKRAAVITHLKEPTVDPDNTLNPYRPVSNSSCISQVVDRFVTSRFRSHPITSQCLLSKQSAY